MGEPVKALALPASVFTRNRKGFPVLPKGHQELLSRFLQLGVQVRWLSGFEGVEHSSDLLMSCCAGPSVNASQLCAWHCESTAMTHACVSSLARAIWYNTLGALCQVLLTNEQPPTEPAPEPTPAESALLPSAAAQVCVNMRISCDSVHVQSTTRRLVPHTSPIPTSYSACLGLRSMSAEQLRLWVSVQTRRSSDVALTWRCPRTARRGPRRS